MMKAFLATLTLLLFPLTGTSAQDLPNYGDAAAAYSLQNYAAAASIWRRLADEGDARAGYHLAMLAEQGLGTERDPGEARRLYQQAAGAGNMAAAARLGAMLLAGGNPEAVRQWLEKAAEAGIARAQYGLAAILLRARGDKRDLIGAWCWLDKAARGFADETNRRAALHSRDLVAAAMNERQRQALHSGRSASDTEAAAKADMAKTGGG